MNISAILLAAGNSKRFGSNKLLARINGIPMYRYAVENMKKLTYCNKIVVTQYEEIRNDLNGSEPEIAVVMNENSDLGISHSIRLGIEASKKADAYLFMVSDQPYLAKETLWQLVEAFLSTDRSIVCAANGSEMGNPVIFSNRYRRELLALSGDRGGKSIVKAHFEEVLLVPVGKRELEDIDFFSPAT